MLRFVRRTLALWVLPVVALAAAPAAEKRVSFSAEAYHSHVKRLASDEFGGRGPGQPGIELAADYIVDVFKEAGLEPAGVEGTWFQPFDIRRGKRLEDSSARFTAAGLDQTFEFKKDWIPFPFTGLGDFEGPVAFAGYGIQSDEFKYNDFADFDPAGKVLIVLRYEPLSADPNSIFGGKTPSSASMFVRKAKWAADRKAKALLVVNPTNRDGDKDDLFTFETSAGQQTYDLPMIHITRAVADALLKKGGCDDIATLTAKIDEKMAPVCCDLKDVTVSGNPGVERNVIKARNVLGVLKGSGNTDETVIVGAHYDHLGTTNNEDGSVEIFNGADDNASGTSGVLELARAFGGQPRPRRNIVFMLFSGEEMGLLGSAHYVQNPTIDLKNIKFMMNLDMIGRYDPEKFEIYGIESCVDFKPLVERLAGEREMKYRAGRELFGRSDHASFQRRQIPVLFMFTGLHPQYHKSSDDADLINAEGATRVLELTYAAVREIAEMTEGPVFALESPPAERPAGDAASQPADAPRADGDGARPSRPRARLGIMPNYSADDDGVKVEDVIKGGAAEAAGIKAGDLVTRIAGTAVPDMQAYMRAMRETKPGDEIEVEVKRGDQTLTLKVKLPEDRSGR